MHGERGNIEFLSLFAQPRTIDAALALMDTALALIDTAVARMNTVLALMDEALVLIYALLAS